jgi:hypothetical protein
MNFEYFKAAYEFEAGRRSQLTSSFSSLLTLATLLAGVLLFYAHHVGSDRSVLTLCFIIGIVGSGWFFVRGVISIGRAATGYKYAYVITGKRLHDWHDSLVRRFPNEPQTVEKAFKEKLGKRYRDAVDVNAATNARKTIHVAAANRSLAICAIIALITAVPYFIISYDKPEPPLKVQIVNPQMYDNPIH